MDYWLCWMAQWNQLWRSVHSSAHQPIHLFVCTPIFPSICLFINPPWFLRIGLLLFSDFLHKVQFNKYIKITDPFLEKKSLLWQKWGKWGAFGPKINIDALFPKSVLQVFLTLCPMKGITKWLKLMALNF